MADREKAYAEWLLSNEDKKGTPEWNTVAGAYKRLRTKKPTLDEQAQKVFGFKDYGENRATILPLAKVEAGKGIFGSSVRPAVPGAVKELMTSALLPGHIAQGNPATMKDALDFSANFALGGAPAVARRGASGKRQFVEDAPSREDLLAKSQKSYDDAEKMGVVVGGDKFADFAAGVENSVSKRIGKNPSRGRRLHPETVNVLGGLADDIGEDIDLGTLSLIRQDIQRATLGVDPQMARDRDVAAQVLEQFDDFVDNLTDADFAASATDTPAALGETVKRARANYRRAKKVQDIDTMITNARTYESGFESGIRRQAQNMLRSRKRLRGWSPDEVAQLNKIAQGTNFGNTLKFLGKFSPSDRGNNILGTTAGAVAGSAALGPVAGPATSMGLSFGARQGASASTMSNVDFLRALAATGGKKPARPSRSRLILGPTIGTGVISPEERERRERIRQWVDEDPDNRV